MTKYIISLIEGLSSALCNGGDFNYPQLTLGQITVDSQEEYEKIATKFINDGIISLFTIKCNEKKTFEFNNEDFSKNYEGREFYKIKENYFYNHHDAGFAYHIDPEDPFDHYYCLLIHLK